MEDVKEKLEKSGMKKKHVARQMGVHPSVLSQALSGSLPYSPAKIITNLNKFLGEPAPGAKIILEK